MTNEMDRVREEFLAETQEILDSVSRDLLELDRQISDGKTGDLDTIHSIFRALHTLKGIAGMFGYADLSDVSHRLEDLLDKLRLGRLSVDADTLDLLFEGVETLSDLLGIAKTGTGQTNVKGLLSRIDRMLGNSMPPEAAPDLELSDDVMSVLTEFEEHRLQVGMQEGRKVYFVSKTFAFDTLDTELDALKSRLKPEIESITYLPSPEAVDDGLRLDILCTSFLDQATVATLAGDDCDVREVGTTARRMQQNAAQAAVVVAHEETPAQEPAHLQDRSAGRTLRVDIDRLDRLMSLVGELGNVKSSLVRALERVRQTIQQSQDKTLASDLHIIQRAFERNLLLLQEGLLTTRMVPLNQTFERLARATRQVSRETGKEVNLSVTGGNTEIDKLIVEELAEPLLHLIRNAIDHGIEAKAEREAIGKPGAGTLAISAYQKGNHVVIDIEDDGKGIDRQKVLNRALTGGLISAEDAAQASEHQVDALLFLPGFSTKDQVSELSGRGVGLDVVKTNIGHLGGIVDVQSEIHVYTKFSLTLPITLAILNALIVRVGDQNFAIPMNVVHEALAVAPDSLRTLQGRTIITVRDESLHIAKLSDLLGIGAATQLKQYAVVVELGKRRLGIVVDEILSQEDIIIKPLGASLRGTRGFSGAADLGERRLVLVLDAAAIMEESVGTANLKGAA